jgi:DNA-binding HxlR family transcriptional regulator
MSGVVCWRVMRTYGQFCPVAKAAELFCERWTPLVLRDLAAGATRFSELQRGVPLMSPSLLSRRLKQLAAEGVVERRPAAQGWTYHLTPAGAEFVPLIEALGTWGQRWSRRELADEEVDLGLLLWSIERAARTDAFGHMPSVVRLELTDQPESKTLWWFLNEPRRCTLCLSDPGFDVDLYLAATLRDMIRLIRGDLPLDRALAGDRLEAHGSAAARRALETWLNLGPLTRIPSQRRSRVA